MKIENFIFDHLELVFAMPEIFLLSSAILILLVDLWLKKSFAQTTYYLAQLSLFITALLAFFLSGERAVIFSGSFVLDPLADILKIFITVMTMATFAYSRHYLRAHDLFRGEYFILTMLAVLGAMVMVSGYSLLTLYLGLEILSLSLYALIAIARERADAIEAALKYFVLGAIASGLLLYGMSMIYGITGSLSIAEIGEFGADSSLSSRDILILNFGLVFLIIGVAFKLGAVPFHMWAPDVYQGSPTAITVFLSTIPKIAAVGLLVRLLIDGLGGMHDYWQNIFMMLAVASVALGSLAALMQSNIKRMLAYSTISHVGFILLGLMTGTSDGYGAMIFYVLAYALMSLAAFGVIIALNKKGFEAEMVSDYKGLSKNAPWLAGVMMIAMLSMAGVPPFVGFYAKLFILQQVVGGGFVAVAVVAVVFAVVSAYYYLRIIKAMYFDKPEKSHAPARAFDLRLTLAINGALILLVGLFPGDWIILARSLF